MTNLLEIALACIARGWYVLPLVPEDKFPIIPKSEGGRGFYDATMDEAQIGVWWERWPNANVGIGCEASDLCIMDADHGLNTYEEFVAWRDRNGIPVTYAVRSGRRPEFGVQMYFRGPVRGGKFSLDGVAGDIKSIGGLVLAAGSVHPDSKERYAAIVEAADLAYTPALLESCRVKLNVNTGSPGEPITENRNSTLTSIAGSLRNIGLSDEALGLALHQVNEDRCVPPLDSEEVDRIAANAAKWDVGGSTGGTVIINGGGSAMKPKSDGKNGLWLSDENAAHLFATRDELETAKPLSFFIEGFLPDDGVTAIAAPVCQRKSLIAQNMARSLLTGDPLFGHFKVLRQPTRVLYLVPELTRCSLKQRLEGLGLMQYVGETLFCRTLNEEGKLWLTDPALRPHLPGSVVFLDTAIRFMKGNENESQDMQVFSEEIFGLLRDGAASVVILHHSRKTGKDAGELTLDAALRGSGELGAFLTTCWATKLNGDDDYKSPSILKNVKQRNIETKPFEVTSNRETGILTMVRGSLGNATVSKPQNRANKDGKDEARMDFLRKNPDLSDRQAATMLKKLKMGRSHQWVHDRREEMALESKGITYNVGGLTVGQGEKAASTP